MNVTLFRKRVFAEDLEMRSFWIIQVDPKSNDKCAYKREKGRRHRHVFTEGHVKTEAEMGVIQPQANDQSPKATRSWKRQGRFSPRDFRGKHGLNFRLLASRSERIHFCCFKPPILW